jgi:hypothetical protein
MNAACTGPAVLPEVRPPIQARDAHTAYGSALIKEAKPFGARIAAGPPTQAQPCLNHPQSPTTGRQTPNHARSGDAPDHGVVLDVSPGVKFNRQVSQYSLGADTSTNLARPLSKPDAMPTRKPGRFEQLMPSALPQAEVPTAEVQAQFAAVTPAMRSAKDTHFAVCAHAILGWAPTTTLAQRSSDS